MASESKVVQSLTKVPQRQVRFEMDVDDHKDAFTRSYGFDVVTPLAGGQVGEKRMVWQEVLTNKKADPPAYALFGMNAPSRRN